MSSNAGGGPEGLTAESRVTVDGVDVRYRFDGAREAPVLMLSNSLGTSLEMWDPQVAAFAARFRLLRYDTRGHGRSGVPPGDYSIERMGRDALGLADALGIDRFRFCGLSMGGMIGMWLGVNAGNRLERLVLCNTAPRIGPADVWNARIARVRAGGMEAIADAVLERWFTAGFRARAADTMAWMRAMLVSMPPEGYVASCAAVREMDQRESIAGISVPTLIVAGTHDAVTTPADGRAMASRIAGSRYVEIDASHISNVEAAERFTSEVVGFLQG